MKMIYEILERLFYTREIEEGVIMYSDQGALYQSSSYQKNLADKGIVQSMSRKAT